MPIPAFSLSLRRLRFCGAAVVTMFVALTGSAMAAGMQPQAAAPAYYVGVNFPQATFGKIPGVMYKDYAWQRPSDIGLFADIGANIFRVGFLWERMQPEPGPLNPRELAALDALVASAAARRVTILLDLHNYGAYRKKLIGTPEVPVSVFADFWSRLAVHYKDQPYVAFGLMNEPNKQSATDWASMAQAAIDAIRATGAKQPIFVPGTYWDGAHSWFAGKPSNATALAAIKDPANNLVFEAHQYFDQDSSGTHAACVSEDIGEKRLAAFTKWLRDTKRKGFLGEFGASKDPVCLEALRRTLAYMNANRDVWAGWAYWAAAPWFGNYMFNVYPPDPARFPQAGVLRQALRAAATTTGK